MKSYGATKMAEMRQRRKEAGLMRVEVWVKPEHAELVKGYAYGLRDVSALMERLTNP